MEENLILKKLSQIAKDISGVDIDLELGADIPATLGMDSFQMAMFFCSVEEQFGTNIHDFCQCRNTTALINVIQEGGKYEEK